MDIIPDAAYDNVARGRIEAELTQLRAVTRQLRTWLWVSLALGTAAVLAAGVIGWVGAVHLLSHTTQAQRPVVHPGQAFPDFERMEMGTFPVELVNQGYTTGKVH